MTGLGRGGSDPLQRVQGQLELHSKTHPPQTNGWEYRSVAEHLSGMHEALNSIHNSYKRVTVGEGCIFNGMVEIEGEYSLSIPVRDVHLGQSDKLG